MSARRDYIAEHAAALRSVLGIVRTYAKQLKQGRDSALLVSRGYDIDLADAESWLEHVQWSNDTRRPDEALRRCIDALQAQGVVASAGPDAVKAIWHSLDDDR